MFGGFNIFIILNTMFIPLFTGFSSMPMSSKPLTLFNEKFFLFCLAISEKSRTFAVEIRTSSINILNK